MTNEHARFLAENGPTRSTAMPEAFNGLSISNRLVGVASFSPPRKANGRIGGRAEVVYYLIDEHDEEAVLREFLDANPSLVENTKASGLRLRLDDPWGDAFMDVWRDYYDEYEAGGDDGGERSYDGTCPLCGSEYTGQLPAHLRGCDG